MSLGLKIVKTVDVVDRSEYDALSSAFREVERDRDNARRGVAHLAEELKRELQNAAALTELAARAIVSADILKNALIERQIGKQNQGDPSQVLVVKLPDSKQSKSSYVPLHRRRRQVAKKRADEEVRRTALPKLLAELPPLPLTDTDCEAMNDAVEELKTRLTAKRTEV